jgi:cytochrome b561
MMPSGKAPVTTLYAALHWLMFLLFVVALATIEYREDIPKGDPCATCCAPYTCMPASWC